MCLDLLLHLYLFMMAFLLVEFGAKAMEFLSILRLLMTFPGYTLPFPLLVVETLSVLLLPPLNVLVLRLDLVQQSCLRLTGGTKGTYHRGQKVARLVD